MEDKSQEIYENIIKLIREELIRFCQTKTQEEAADLCAITQSAINRLIRGTRGENLPFKTVIKVALALDLDLAALLQNTPRLIRKKSNPYWISLVK